MILALGAIARSGSAKIAWATLSALRRRGMVSYVVDARPEATVVKNQLTKAGKESLATAERERASK